VLPEKYGAQAGFAAVEYEQADQPDAWHWVAPEWKHVAPSAEV
jgi:hypothetical protein